MQKIRDDIYLGNNNTSLCNVGYILNIIAKENNTFFIWWIKRPFTCICEQQEYENNLMWHEDNVINKPTWDQVYKTYLDICKSKGLEP